ncbi:MAG: flippase-like domain-containing protein [Flavobacteriales bacterium]|nr:flippase-like domain-containing protein [Flavobacteriales bacterium]
MNFFSPKRIIIPVGIGILSVVYLLFTSIDITEFQNLSWNFSVFSWLLVAVLMMLIRDIAYMYRIRVLTNNEISWRNSFDVIMLWEFASAITPSVVGGAGIAVFIINREKISLGRSTAIVMTTAFLDELFYIVTVPIIVLLVGVESLFPSVDSRTFLGFVLPIEHVFVVGYVFILLLTLVILYATFFNPKGFKTLLVKICSIKYLKRWQESAVKMGDDIVATSKELKGKPIQFWLKAFGATIFAWTARFWVVNFIILAFSETSSFSHFGIYARQLVMWVIMLISPTPGSTGVAEVLFPQFLGDYISSVSPEILGLLWRVLSYWPYLLIGVIVLPKWIQRVFLKRKLIKFKNTN